MALTVLAIHAHPDDIEILAAGTLALLRQAKHDLVFATMTPGDKGTRLYSAEEISRLRREEAAQAARILDASYHCLEFRDLAIFCDDPSRRRVTELLRAVRPAIVLTSAPSDYLADHEATSQLVRDACFAAPTPLYETGAAAPAPPLEIIPHLYFMDPVAGMDRDQRPVKPDFLVDIGLTFPLKRSMLAKHESQRAWLQAHHGMDNYLLEMERWTRAQGARAGVAFAEGFRQYRGHPYPATPLLQDLLGQFVCALRE